MPGLFAFLDMYNNNSMQLSIVTVTHFLDTLSKEFGYHGDDLYRKVLGRVVFWAQGAV